MLISGISGPPIILANRPDLIDESLAAVNGVAKELATA
jgi:hypothetical protein